MFLAVFFRTFHKKSPNVTVRESLLQTESENLLVTYSPFLDYKKKQKSVKIWGHGPKKGLRFSERNFPEIYKKNSPIIFGKPKAFFAIAYFWVKKDTIFMKKAYTSLLWDKTPSEAYAERTRKFLSVRKTFG